MNEEINRAVKIADLFLEHNLNDKGEVLANVHESPAFQEIYDFRGGEQRRWRLERKKEQVFNQYDATKQLFQKVYYAKGLTADDESKLRSAFTLANSQHEYFNQVAAGVLFVAFFPLTYRIARQVKPSAVAVWSLAYYSTSKLPSPSVFRDFKVNLMHRLSPSLRSTASSSEPTQENIAIPQRYAIVQARSCAPLNKNNFIII